MAPILFHRAMIRSRPLSRLLETARLCESLISPEAGPPSLSHCTALNSESTFGLATDDPPSPWLCRTKDTWLAPSPVSPHVLCAAERVSGVLLRFLRAVLRSSPSSLSGVSILGGLIPIVVVLRTVAIRTRLHMGMSGDDRGSGRSFPKRLRHPVIIKLISTT